MANVKLEKRASLEFTLFERFAEFLAELEFPGDKKLSIAAFHKYVGDFLLGGNIDANSVRNIFVKTGKYSEVEESRFKYFCETFASKFRSSSEDQKTIYKEMNDAFIQWRNKIFQKRGWELPVTDTNKITTENNPSLSSDGDIMRQIDLLSDEGSAMYRSLNEEPYFYEAWAFDQWRRTARWRLSDEINKYKNVTVLIIEKLLKQFSEGGLELFMVKNNKIIKKQICFADIKQDFDFIITGRFYSDPSQGLSFGKFIYNCEEEVLVIGNERFARGDNLSAYMLNIRRRDVMADLSHSLNNKYYGYFITTPDIGSTELTVKLALASFNKIKEEYVTDIVEYDVRDEEIPFKTRSFLNELSDDFPKEIDPDFVYKSVAYFVRLIGLRG